MSQFLVVFRANDWQSNQPCNMLISGRSHVSQSVPEFIDPVFTKTSPKRSFSLNRKQAFWLVFAKTGSIISGTGFKTHKGVEVNYSSEDSGKDPG